MSITFLRPSSRLHQQLCFRSWGLSFLLGCSIVCLSTSAALAGLSPAAWCPDVYALAWLAQQRQRQRQRQHALRWPCSPVTCRSDKGSCLCSRLVGCCLFTSHLLSCGPGCKPVGRPFVRAKVKGVGLSHALDWMLSAVVWKSLPGRSPAARQTL